MNAAIPTPADWPFPGAAPHGDLVLIGLTGKAGAGKDAVADRLCNQFGFVRASFAAPIKIMLEALLSYVGEDHAWLHERRLKERTIASLRATPRHMMQTLGTEWGRQCMRPSFWLDLQALHLGLAESIDAPVHDRIVLTDCRFPNEAAWIRQHGGEVVRIVRDQAAAIRTHASETQMDSIEPDTTIWNHGPTLEGLHALVDGLAATLGCEPREPMPQEFTTP